MERTVPVAPLLALLGVVFLLTRVALGRLVRLLLQPPESPR